MATYQELAGLLEPDGDQGLRGKVLVATLIALENIRTETPADPNNPTAAEQARKRFAQDMMRSVSKEIVAFHREFERVYRAVIIQNSSAPLGAILSASDAAIQTAVTAAVDFFAALYPNPLPAP